MPLDRTTAKTNSASRRVDTPLGLRARVAPTRPLPRSRPRVTRSRTIPVRALLTLGLVLVVGLGWWGAASLWRQRTAAAILRQLDRAPVESLEGLLGRARVLGDDGRRVLLEGTLHPRDVVRSASRRQLDAEIDAWRTLDAATASRRIAWLADQLVEILPRTPATGKRYLASLGSELLTWPIDRDAIDATRLVARCEVLLRAGFEAVPLRSIDDLDAESTDPDDTAPGRVPAMMASRATPIDEPSESLPTFPPLEPTPPIVDPWQGVAEGPVEPLLPAETAEPSRFRPLGASTELADAPSDARGTPPIVDPNVGPPAVADVWSEGRVRGASHLELLRRLHLADIAESAAALAELRRRGFRPEMITLGERLTDPDREIRLAAIEHLRENRRLDPIPWLMVAAKDEDPQVRRAALVALAGAEDPFQARWAQRRLEEMGESTIERR